MFALRLFAIIVCVLFVTTPVMAAPFLYSEKDFVEIPA
jgi:hypothetical protein